MLGECNDILRTLAQRRHAKLKLSQTMEKILAKASRGYRCFQVLISSGNDAHVDFNFPITAQSVKRISVQHSQQLDLRVQLQFPDFIQEERAPVREFKQSRLGNIGPGERPFLVAEQFALHQILRKSSAVDVDPGAAASMRRLVNRTGNQFLSRSRFSRNQDGLRMPGDAVHHTDEFVHQRTGKNERRTLNLPGRCMREPFCRLLISRRLHVARQNAFSALFGDQQKQSDHSCGDGPAVAQHRNREPRTQFLAGLTLTLALRCEMAFVQNPGQHRLVQWNFPCTAPC